MILWHNVTIIIIRHSFSPKVCLFYHHFYYYEKLLLQLHSTTQHTRFLYSTTLSMCSINHRDFVFIFAYTYPYAHNTVARVKNFINLPFSAQMTYCLSNTFASMYCFVSFDVVCILSHGTQKHHATVYAASTFNRTSLTHAHTHTHTQTHTL